MSKIWQAAKLRAALLTAAAGAATAAPALAQEAQTLQTFSIPSQSTASALIEFARQADAQILFSHEAASQTTSPALVGEFTREQGLQRLLLGSSLSVASDDGRTITLRAQEEAQAGPAQPDAPERVENAADHVAQGEIVIVGTNIRGYYPEASPVAIYDMEDIARTGAVTMDKFVEKLPENFGTRSQYTQFATAIVNFEGVTGLDLRGLGVGTTLTLLNGRRLALASNGQAADVSMIPLSAIERVEVLTDGASAIYGADAVGGVVNFVLRDSFEGAETKASYGGVTEGNLRQGNFSQNFGRSWNTGSVLASYDYHSASALETTDRSYAAGAEPVSGIIPPPGHLTPIDQRQSALVTVSQDLGDRVTVNGDVVFSQRDVKTQGTRLSTTNPANHQRFESSGETNQYFVNLGADVEITETLVGSILASYSDIDVDTDTATTFFNRPTPARTPSTRDTAYSALDVTAKLGGDLFNLPGGAVRFSVGGGLLDEEYRADALFNANLPSGKDLGRTTTYAFAELFAPIIGADQNIPFLHRLELSLAARYTDYEDQSEPALSQDFGSATSPKIGLLWSPVQSLNLRATYGESFRAPTLAELDPTQVQSVLRPTAQSGLNAPTLIISGPAPDLDVETSESWTAGFDFKPGDGDGFYLSATYFSIDYIDRIAGPNIGLARANPAAFSDVIFHPASAAQIEQLLGDAPVTSSTLPGFTVPITDLQTAAQNLFAISGFWVSDFRLRNFSQSKIDGFDVSVGHNFDTQIGRFDLGVQATRILEFKEQATPGSPVASGTDIILNPADFRGRFFAAYSAGGFSTAFNVNYVDDYKNPLSTGAVKVDDWTTVDWNTRYEFGAEEGILRGLGFTLNVQNLLDEDPPSVQRNDVASLVNAYGYDPANANPLGRLVVFGISKTW